MSGQINSSNYLDHYHTKNQRGSGKIEGLADGLELFSTPDEAQFSFFILPHAKNLIRDANGYFTVDNQTLFNAPFYYSVELYDRFMGANGFVMSPINDHCQQPDMMRQELERRNILFKKRVEMEATAKGQEDLLLRDTVRTQRRVLLMVVDGKTTKPKLWVLGSKTYEEKIWPAICSPILQNNGIVIHDPSGGMWFSGGTTGKGRDKRIGAAQPMHGSPMPLFENPQHVQECLSQIIALEQSIRTLTTEETGKMLQKAFAFVETTKVQINPGQPPVVQGNGMPPVNPAQPMTPAIPSYAPVNQAPVPQAAPVTPPIPQVTPQVTPSTPLTPATTENIPSPPGSAPMPPGYAPPTNTPPPSYKPPNPVSQSVVAAPNPQLTPPTATTAVPSIPPGTQSAQRPVAGAGAPQPPQPGQTGIAAPANSAPSTITPPNPNDSMPPSVGNTTPDLGPPPSFGQPVTPNEMTSQSPSTQGR